MQKLAIIGASTAAVVSLGIFGGVVYLYGQQLARNATVERPVSAAIVDQNNETNSEGKPNTTELIEYKETSTDLKDLTFIYKRDWSFSMKNGTTINDASGETYSWSKNNHRLEIQAQKYTKSSQGCSGFLEEDYKENYIELMVDGTNLLRPKVEKWNKFDFGASLSAEVILPKVYEVKSSEGFAGEYQCTIPIGIHKYVIRMYFPESRTYDPKTLEEMDQIIQSLKWVK